MFKFKYSEEAQQKIQEVLQEKTQFNELLALNNQAPIAFSPREIEQFMAVLSAALLKDIGENSKERSPYPFSLQENLLQSSELQNYLKVEIENTLRYKEFLQTTPHLTQWHYTEDWKNLIYQIKDFTKDIKEGIEPQEYEDRYAQLALNYKSLCQEKENIERFSLIDPELKGFTTLVFRKQNFEVLRILLSLGYNPLLSSVRTTCDILANHSLKKEVLPLEDIKKFHQLGLNWDWLLVFGGCDGAEEIFMPDDLKGKSVLKTHPLTLILNQPLNQFKTPEEKNRYLDFFAKHSAILNDADILELINSYCPDTEGEQLCGSFDYFFATQEKQKLLEGTIEVIEGSKITFKI